MNYTRTYDFCVSRLIFNHMFCGNTYLYMNSLFNNILVSQCKKKKKNANKCDNMHIFFLYGTRIHDETLRDRICIHINNNPHCCLYSSAIDIILLRRRQHFFDTTFPIRIETYLSTSTRQSNESMLWSTRFCNTN